MNKNIFSIVILFSLLTTTLSAAPIGEQRAREIATKFFLQSGTRSATPVLRLDWAGKDAESVDVVATRSSANTSTTDDALLYVYNRVDTKGFVIVSGEDKYENAIIGFSHDNRFDTEDMADGAKWMLWAWSKQLAAIRSEVRPHSATRGDTSVGTIDCRYDTALWGQDAPFNNLSPTFDGKTSPSGCVATAMAIICYHHKWPDCGVGTTPEYTYTQESGNKVTIPENTLGRKYDYTKMLSAYKTDYTEEQAEQVANLLYDLATAVKMAFEPGGSGSNGVKATIAFRENFKYSKGALNFGNNTYSHEEWVAMVKKNLKEYGPTYYQGNSDSGGHAFLLDGYTSKDFFEVNFGWNGNSNGYYLLPSIKYNIGQGAIFYLTPDYNGTSTYRDYLTLRAMTASGNVYKGLRTDETKYEVGKSFKSYVAFYNSGEVDFSGTICIAHCDKDGKIKEELWSKEISNLFIDRTSSFLPTLTLSKSIAQGDRLYALYKGTASDAKWERARRTNNLAYDEVLLKATPAEVAKTLNLSYNKSSKELTFESQHALQYSVKDSSSKTIESKIIPSFTQITIDLSTYKSGKYTFSFASGGDPYVVTITL